MKFVKQFLIILLISFIGEALGRFLFLPIPGSIYGLLIMLVCLCTKIIKVESVKDVSAFLIEILPLMFIPAAVGLVESYVNFKSIFLPVAVITVVSTVVVMGVTGVVTQAIIRCSGKAKEEKKHD